MVENMKTLKNIIIICDYAKIEGGAARVAHENAIAFSEKYHTVLFSAVGPVSEELKNSKVEVCCLNEEDILHNGNRIEAVQQGLNNTSAANALEALLNKYSSDDTIVHIHTWTKALSSSIFAQLAKTDFKVILTVHDYFLECPNGGFFNYCINKNCELVPMSMKCRCTNCDSRSYAQKLYRVLRQSIQNRNIKKCNNIRYLFVSEMEKEKMIGKSTIDFSNSMVLQNPINFSNRFRVSCETNKLYLYVGRLTDEKGIRVFCEAVTNAGVQAAVIGRGKLLDELKQKYANIKFCGWLDKDQILTYIKKTRCLIYPSIYSEPFGLTPLEMMAYGIPCILSDCTSVKELVPNSDNVIVYNGYSSTALTQAIIKSRNNALVKKMSTSIYTEFDEKKYSMSTYLETLQKIYLEALGE